ncbi:GNAT family N-acetyltransferase [Actinomadura rupiterrae]|uniref:GNAT family N-acetyltransferase n=1 Tax=Actinomadura rupiterrae TaxID=559627 RepID=UPI0020A3EBEF|nr:GNAT family N-acetyltransferase [Actinomadura rupiterrae]MCP2342972.1 GNAT superfamily N-acetyltransferase [Actinomadura rupiterrae]
MADDTLQLYTGGQAREVFEDVLAAYVEVYSVPPYAGDPFFSPETARARIDLAMDAPEFQVITAHNRHDVIGFVYGATLPVDAPWWSQVSGQSDTLLRQDVEAGRVAWLRELLVRDAWRGTGVGRRLHDEWVAQRSLDFGQQWSALTCIPDNEPAHDAYLRWGYEIIGQIKHASESPIYDAMTRPIPR